MSRRFRISTVQNIGALAAVIVFSLLVKDVAAGPESEYKDYGTGFWGSTLSPELGTDPPVYGSDHFEVSRKIPEGRPRERKVYIVGTVLLKDDAKGKEKLYFLPLMLEHMGVEWWTLTGKAADLKAQLIKNKTAYAKLRGIVRHEKTLHKHGIHIMGYHVVFNTFEIQEVVWVKTKAEIETIRTRINELVEQGKKKYKERDFETAVKLSKEAEKTSKKFLPNLRYEGERYIRQAEEYIGFERGATGFPTKKDYLEFLGSIAGNWEYRKSSNATGCADPEKKLSQAIAEIRRNKCDKYLALVSHLEALRGSDREVMEEILILKMEEDIIKGLRDPNVNPFTDYLKVLDWGNLLVKVGDEKSLHALLKYKELFRRQGPAGRRFRATGPGLYHELLKTLKARSGTLVELPKVEISEKPGMMSRVFNTPRDRALSIARNCAYKWGNSKDPKEEECNLENILPLVKDQSNPDTRRFAAKALGALGGEGAVPELKKLLRDDSRMVQMEAANALLRIDKEKSPATRLQILKEGGSAAREFAVATLGEPKDSSMIDALKEAREDQDFLVRLFAERALKRDE